jgi:hypothetical protein
MPLGGFIPDSPWIYYANKFSKHVSKYGRGAVGSPGTALGFSVGRVVIYKAALHKELNTNSGGLWRALEIRGNKAVKGAKRMVGVKTGRLRTSIHMRHTGNSTGQYLWIGSQVNYAYMHHQGTRPHLIAPKAGVKALRFSSKGRVVITPGPVMHPGTKPNPYLSAQLRHFAFR